MTDHTPRKFTGLDRRRTTSWRVAAGDRIAKGLITVGGIGTIVAVLLVCVYLFSVVLPLFLPAKVERTSTLPAALAGSDHAQEVLRIGADEFGLIGWGLLADGRLDVFRLDNGQRLKSLSPRESGLAGLKSVALAVDGQHVACGFADGKVRLGRIGFATRFVEPSGVPPEVRALKHGEVAEWDGGMVSRTPTGQFRRQKLVVELDDPLALASGQAIVLVDHVDSAGGSVVGCMSADGKLRVSSIEIKENMLTGERTPTLDTATLSLPPDANGLPKFLRISGLGDYLYLAWPDGRLLRYEIRNLAHPRLVEDVRMFVETPATLTALEPLLGGTSLVAGDSLGRVRIWFPVAIANNDPLAPPDKRKLVRAQEFVGAGGAVTAIAPGGSAREVAVGDALGNVRLLFVTSSKMVLDLHAGEGQPIAAVAIAPKGDLLLAATSAGVTLWGFDPEHPDASLAALFLPVWYEGEPGPKLTWQTSGSEGFEPKLSLTPLIFGTLKAVFYSMLFGAPLALMAAIYTSEFLSAGARGRIKPIIELMASLPSVVLGFLAALVIAPVVGRIIPEVVAGIVTLPLSLLLGAYIWQMLPREFTLRLARYRFLVILLVVLPAGIVAAALLGPALEKFLFGGDVKAWLNHQRGSATPGWMIILLPFGAMTVLACLGPVVNPWLRRVSATWERGRIAAVELLKFVVGVALTLLLVAVVGVLLDLIHVDPRGSFVGKYEQLNSLVVGIVMGFAIIPLIYTLADDALTAVPSHLRSASLGAGATPWQTAMRVVVPTAMSGLFSAVMIGLGRAVGETMIVLMAAGGTPIIDLNIFNGFQTLSAGIASQLPEAAVGTTHYRTLFLAALALFLMTFVVNTIAEVVRQRFRRRAYEL